jgi:hypothetical protein
MRTVNAFDERPTRPGYRVGGLSGVHEGDPGSFEYQTGIHRELKASQREVDALRACVGAPHLDLPQKGEGVRG